MLNFITTCTFYATLALLLVFVPLAIFFSVRWILQAYQCNQRAKQWAKEACK